MSGKIAGGLGPYVIPASELRKIVERRIAVIEGLPTPPSDEPEAAAVIGLQRRMLAEAREELARYSE